MLWILFRKRVSLFFSLFFFFPLNWVGKMTSITVRPSGAKANRSFSAMPSTKEREQEAWGIYMRGKTGQEYLMRCGQAGVDADRCARKRKSSTYWERRRRGSPQPWPYGSGSSRANSTCSFPKHLSSLGTRIGNGINGSCSIYFLLHPQRPHLHSKDVSFFIVGEESGRQFLWRLILRPLSLTWVVVINMLFILGHLVKNVLWVLNRIFFF